jgi:hypothetical protein
MSFSESKALLCGKMLLQIAYTYQLIRMHACDYALYSATLRIIGS